MTCTQVREVLSASLDGEDAGLPVAQARRHTAGCADCQRWIATAERVNRQVRLHVAEDVPDLTERVLTAVQARARGPRRRLGLRIAVAIAAVVQLVLALPELSDVLSHVDSHAGHEMVAFDLALSVGFVLAAIRPERARPLVPVAVVLSVALMVLAGMDIAHGEITVTHELAHLVAVDQAVLLWALCRTYPARARLAH